MAQNNSTVTQETPKREARPMLFSEQGNLYQLRPAASQAAIINHLSARLTQLESMLAQTYGSDEEEGFNSWPLRVRDGHLWACQMIASECEDLVSYIELKGESHE